MQTLKLDAGNNLVVSQKNIAVISGIDACAQDTARRVGLVRGENPMNTNEGIDYMNGFLGKPGTASGLEAAVRSRISDNPEIYGISSLDMELDGTVLTIRSEVDTIYGTINI